MRLICVRAVAMVALLGLVLSAAPAEAQLCAGSPSFRDQPYQAGITAGFTEGAHGVGGFFGTGGESLFAIGSIGVVNYRDLDALATQISASVGADLATSQSSRVFVCPVASIGFGAGPDIGDVDISTFSLGAGGDVGIIAYEINDLRVVPTFGVSVAYNRINAEFGGSDATESDTSGLANIGVGFILSQNIGILPAVSVPFSAGGSDPTFVIRLSFGFGR
jgi:hypothetical protein